MLALRDLECCLIKIPKLGKVSPYAVGEPSAQDISLRGNGMLTGIAWRVQGVAVFGMSLNSGFTQDTLPKNN